MCTWCYAKMVTEPEKTVNMLEQVLAKLIKKNWMTSEEVDIILAQYKSVIKIQAVSLGQICLIHIWRRQVGFFLI